MRLALPVIGSLLFALAVVAPATAADLDGAFWLKQYEDADPMWNAAAWAYVLGVLDGSGTFGGIRCPTPVSPRMVTAMTADVIKQSATRSLSHLIAARPWRKPRNRRRIRLGWTPTQPNGRNPFLRDARTAVVALGKKVRR